MIRIKRMLLNRLIRNHCLNEFPTDRELFKHLKIVMKNNKNVFLDNKRKALHIINTKDKTLFKIQKVSQQWNLKMILWPNDKKFLCLDEYYGNIKDALNKMENINNPI